MVIFSILYRTIIEFVVNHFHMISKWLTFIGLWKELEVIIPTALAVGIGIGLFGSAVSVIRNAKEVIE